MPRNISSCLLCRTQSDSSDNEQFDPPPLSGTNVAVDGRSERLSAATLASLRNTVLHSASTGDVRDVYRFGRTLGARLLRAPRRESQRSHRPAFQAPAATRWSRWLSTVRPARKWLSRL
jgi:hypothetical protein